jgi:hypothetical protein
MGRETGKAEVDIGRDCKKDLKGQNIQRFSLE